MAPYTGPLFTPGDRIKAWRISQGLSQARVANLLGVPVTTFQNWEVLGVMPPTEARARITGAIGFDPFED